MDDEQNTWIEQEKDEKKRKRAVNFMDNNYYH